MAFFEKYCASCPWCSNKIIGTKKIRVPGTFNQYKTWSCPKSIEVIFFNKSANDFFMDFYRARKADCFTGESFDTRSECQVITLNALGVDLAH